MAISRRFNGGIIGSRNLSGVTGAAGIWTPGEIQLARLSNIWPDDTGILSSQIFTTSSSWTVPAGVTSVEYLVVAGGGAGDGAFSGYDAGIGGGGAGGLRSGTNLSVTPGQSYAIVIGAGGTFKRL